MSDGLPTTKFAQICVSDNTVETDSRSRGRPRKLTDEERAERKRESLRKYRIKNAERFAERKREQARIHYRNHREEISQRNNDYYHAHREEIRQKWAEKHGKKAALQKRIETLENLLKEANILPTQNI